MFGPRPGTLCPASPLMNEAGDLSEAGSWMAPTPTFSWKPVPKSGLLEPVRQEQKGLDVSKML